MDDVRNVKAEKGYSVYSILSKLDADIPENIHGLHGQTGYDTSAPFSGISKIKYMSKEEPGSLETATVIEDLSLFLPVWQLRWNKKVYVDSIQFQYLFQKVSGKDQEIPKTHTGDIVHKIQYLLVSSDWYVSPATLVI